MVREETQMAPEDAVRDSAKDVKSEDAEDMMGP